MCLVIACTNIWQNSITDVQRYPVLLHFLLPMKDPQQSVKIGDLLMKTSTIKQSTKGSQKLCENQAKTKPKMSKNQGISLTGG